MAWTWCVLYTAVTPPAVRQRRRTEILSHLYESERAGYPARAVLAAVVRGMPDDLGWAGSTVLAAAGRLLRVPMTYVILALAFVLQAWAASAFASTSTAHRFEAAGLIGSATMLGVAALASRARRTRR